MYIVKDKSTHPVLKSKFFKTLTKVQKALVEDLTDGYWISFDTSEDMNTFYARLNRPPHAPHFPRRLYENMFTVSKHTIKCICNKPGAREWLDFIGTEIDSIRHLKIKR